jgi:predicted Zn-ribbon and HTH transcriptional regulator
MELLCPLAAVLLSLSLCAATTDLARRVFRRPRGRRYEQHQCARCGYDIRFNVHRCPECGDNLFEQAKRYWGERLQ